MKVETKHIQEGLSDLSHTFLGEKADLVLYFGERKRLVEDNIYHHLQKIYPKATILGCSTGGEIFNNRVFDGTVASVAIDFEKTTLHAFSTHIQDHPCSLSAGISLAKQMPQKDLKGVFILTDGLLVESSLLLEGLTSIFGKDVILVGGLAGDNHYFKETIVGLNAAPTQGNIAILGFYGEHFHIDFGSAGGWDPHGPERKITKSKGNILYEIDEKPAMDLYKKYLGNLTEKEENYALCYPFSLWPDDKKETSFIRSVVFFNEEEKSITFSSHIPEGYTAQLMRGFIPKLIEGAQEASQKISEKLENKESVALLISCMGRRVVLGHHTQEEVISVCESFEGKNCHTLGFYAYGEISPRKSSHIPELHNQTMTVASFFED